MTFKHLPKYFTYPASLYVAAVSLMALLRVIFILMTAGKLSEVPGNEMASCLSWAFFMGWRYDTVAATYLTIIPFLMLVVAQLLRFHRPWYFSLVTVVSIVLFSSAILCASVDIPYFKYYDARVSVTIFQWLDGGITTFKVMFEEPSYLFSGVIFLVASFLFALVILKLKKTFLVPEYAVYEEPRKIWIHAGTILLMLALLFHGVKANFKSPVRIIDAMKTRYSYINQLALNPVFTLTKSYLMNKKMDFMPGDAATANTRRFMGITDTCFASPLSRNVVRTRENFRPNIVLIFMESQSSVNMSHFGNKDNITPELDSLARRGVFFDNIYSIGTHTHNAIFSTMWAYPTLSRVRHMCANNTNKYTGFPGLTRNMGYRNLFFVTHDKGFDNIFDFILGNDFDTIISRENYPDSLSVNAFGVPDHVIFNRSISVFNKTHEKGQKFFGVLLTNSNHMPYCLPKDIPFAPRSKTIDNEMVEYADWAIGDFLRKAQKQPWFDSTIFILVGDHGQIRYKNVYDMPLSYNHVPLIIYAPKLLPEAKIVHGYGGQCDIFPTVMGIIGKSYVNNTPGVDLLREKRPCMFFTSDYKIGCINDDYFYVFRESGGESLYKYRDNDTRDYRNELPGVADSLKLYALSIIQASQLNIKYNRTASDTCR